LIHRYVEAKSAGNSEKISENLLKIVKYTINKEATKGLSLLSIFASTSPFIGLFGTVVSILETFANLGDAELGAISVIAQGVSEALVATAVGIFVATFAYAYHQILNRKAYELMKIIDMEIETILLGNSIKRGRYQQHYSQQPSPTYTQPTIAAQQPPSPPPIQ
jgi:biopolymer transport protein ExbB/TolQ